MAGMLAPPRTSVVREVSGLLRGIGTLPALVVTGRSSLPRGHGAPVIVVPGYMTGDISTVALRSFLRLLDYDVRGWGLGINRGNLGKMLPKVVDCVRDLAARRASRVCVIGWSLGGVLARDAARRIPQHISRVITLGTPVIGGPKYTATAGAYRRRGVDLDALEHRIAQQNALPLQVPITAIYSKLDGIVAWEACLDPNPDNRVEHIEVRATHCELAFSASVLRVIAERLGRG